MNFLISGVLIDRYWRVFLNYQKTENVLTAKASRYTKVIWIVLFHELKQLKCLYSGTRGKLIMLNLLIVCLDSNLSRRERHGIPVEFAI